MMRFWLREIAGWLLVGLGLVVFYLCWQMLGAGMIFEAPPMAVIGIVLYRGGVHLIKVAVAAQICLEAQRRMGEAARPAVAATRRETVRIRAPATEP